MPTPHAPKHLLAAAQPFVYPARQLATTLRSYRPTTFRQDLIAGLTVAVVEVPQAMAYAYIAGVPPQYGIYTSIIQGFFGALFASNDHLASGPTNTQSLLIAAAASQVVDPGNEALYLQIVIGLTLIKGLIQLVFAAARMGNLVRYVSASVIIGFTAGAGVLIAAGQVPAFLGMDVAHDPDQLPGVLGTIQSLAPHLADISPITVGVGMLALVIVLGSRLISPLVPGPLLAVVLPAAVVWAMGWDDGRLALVGQLPQGLPDWSMPSLSMSQIEALLGGAFALALLGMIETVSIGKSLSAQTGHRISANQEFFAQGLANVVGSFFQNIAGSGSFTRSALNFMAGGQTRLAGIYNAGFVALIFLLFAPQARFIPLASLAAILFVVAYGLIDWKAIRRIIRSGRSDALVCVITFLAALLLPLAYAIYVGIFLNIALYLRRASQLHMAEMVRTSGGPFQERPITDRSGEKKVIFLSVEGDLFFGVADELQDRLIALARSGPRVVILRLKRTHSIDATVQDVLERFTRQMQAKGGHVLLCGVKPELMERIRRYGLIALIGEKNVFETGFGVFTSAKQALQRARELVGASLDADELGEADETEGWAYEI